MNSSTIQLLQPDSGRQGVIFLVDSAEYMFEVDEEDKEKRTHMLIALKSIRNEMNMICCSADTRHMLGIIFFNTTKTNIKAENLDNIFVYRPMLDYNDDGTMKSLDADGVRQIDDLINDEKKLKEFFEDTLGGSGQADYSQLLWLVQRNFRYDINAQKKAVFVLTRNQFLEDYDEALIQKVKLQIQNIKNDGIQITHMLLGETEVAEHLEALDVDTEVFDTVEKLTSGLKRRNVTRRPAVTIPLSFGGGINLAVSVFYLLAPQKLETGVLLDEKTNDIYKCKTRFVKQPVMNEMMSLSRIIGEEQDETQTPRETVNPKNIKLTHRIGGVDVELSKEDFEKFKRSTSTEPGIYIIGFKPMKYLKTSHQIGPSQYLFPNESLITGSNVMYRALFTRCLVRNLFILARFVLKTNTTPKLVALVPQRRGEPESAETDVEGFFYEGFHVIHLPFAEDKRNLQSKLEGDWPTASDDQVKAAETFVQKLTGGYTPETYSNPVLQKHYWMLEGLATENDEYGEDYEFDQIKPYFEVTDRGKNEVQALERKL